jgi:hypothetical protein
MGGRSSAPRRDTHRTYSSIDAKSLAAEIAQILPAHKKTVAQERVALPAFGRET